MGCARPGRPPGGPEDRIPPMVISTWPDTLEIIEPTRDPIRIRYNERISERPTQGTMDDAVLISPETGEVRVKHKRGGLEISLEGGLKPDLVYLSFVETADDITLLREALARRGLELPVVGLDVVEVSPPFDPSGQTAWVGVNIMFELLCVLADAVGRH